MDLLRCHCATRLWGDVVVWGTLNKKNSAGECCDSCLNFKPNGPDDPDCNGAWETGPRKLHLKS